MNRGNVRQKRSLGKSSPLSKRPKLDFGLKTRDCLADKNIDFDGSYEKTIKDACATVDLVENKVNGTCAAEPDWDDDFSGDMLEKVCLIADLSQAMVNNQTVTEKIETSKVQIFEGNIKVNSIAEPRKSNSFEDYEKLKSEFIELQEKLKTKEGEVHILRSQLKQNEDAKQAAALQNIKVVDVIEKKYNEKISLIENELETVKSKLQFKDMEYKTLSERCQQLEYCMSKKKLNEDLNCTQGDSVKILGGFSQVVQQKFQNKEGEIEHDASKTEVKSFNEEILEVDFNNIDLHEGKRLQKCLCPEVFEFIEEPSIIHFHIFGGGINYRKSKLDYDKNEKYKWSDLPQPTIFLKDLCNSISSLFMHESFSPKEIKRKVEKIVEYCEKILLYNKEVLLFLEKLHLHNSEYDDSDQSLLENEDDIHLITIKNLLQGKRLTAEECGIEGRRALGVIYALMTASRVASEFIKNKPNFLLNLKCIASTIGNLRRPLRYTGILVGISFILKRLLLEENLERSIVVLITEVVEEIIFARPKLDVFIEVVNVLAAGKNHFMFLSALCRKASLDSCSLYMDSKLKQAMFFTKNACPLKLLCMQIMGLACLPSSKNIKWDLTSCIIKWLNNSINTPEHKKIKWLPVNSLLNEKDRCFDVTECLLYLLITCLKDYQVRFSRQENSDEGNIGCNVQQFGSKRDPGMRKKHLISIIGHGAVLIKRILKMDQRQLHDNSYSVRFAVLLKSLMLEESEVFLNHLSSLQMEAIKWLTDSLEIDLRNQDCYSKQNTSTIPDVDILKALKIEDESKIY